LCPERSLVREVATQALVTPPPVWAGEIPSGRVLLFPGPLSARPGLVVSASSSL